MGVEEALMVDQTFPVREDVREAAVRPIARSGKRFWVLLAVLALLVVWGVVAYAVQLVNGLGAAGYSDTGFWGIYEANLVAFIAVSYGGRTRRLDSFEDVTDTVRSGIKSKADAAANAERNIAIAAIENQCSATTGLRCEVVTFYRGAAYELYRYRVWTDVRLVFAPETRVAFFGGDPDNFVYPRFDLDFALMRVYDGGAPLRPAHYLTWTGHGASEGDLVFAAGHPYSTDRLVTIAQLELDRDARYPLMIAGAKREQRILQQFGAQSAEATRRAADELLGTENWLKAMLGEYKALQEPALMRFPLMVQWIERGGS